MLFTDAKVAFPFRGVRDGELLELGNVSIKVLHTPGHTPEHISLLVTDRTRSDEPWFLLTGHTLMVGDLGRTELATNAEDGARALFQSAHGGVRLRRSRDAGTPTEPTRQLCILVAFPQPDSSEAVPGLLAGREVLSPPLPFLVAGQIRGAHREGA